MRYTGFIGIRSEPIETEPGIYEQNVREVKVKGDLYPTKTTWPNTNMDRVSLNMTFSFMIPDIEEVSFYDILYLVYKNRKWSVVGFVEDRPRLKLTIGGLYNE